MVQEELKIPGRYEHPTPAPYFLRYEYNRTFSVCQ